MSQYFNIFLGLFFLTTAFASKHPWLYSYDRGYLMSHQGSVLLVPEPQAPLSLNEYLAIQENKMPRRPQVLKQIVIQGAPARTLYKFLAQEKYTEKFSEIKFPNLKNDFMECGYRNPKTKFGFVCTINVPAHGARK